MCDQGYGLPSMGGGQSLQGRRGSAGQIKIALTTRWGPALFQEGLECLRVESGQLIAGQPLKSPRPRIVAVSLARRRSLL